MTERGYFESWLNHHNHKMELLRTVTSFIAAVTGIFVFGRVFGYLWDALDSFAEEISAEDWQQYACVSLDRDMGRIGSNLAP